MKVYHDRGLIGACLGVLYCLLWQGLRLPAWIIAVIAAFGLLVSSVGYYRTRRQYGTRNRT